MTAIVHGSLTAYVRQKCRCEVCRCAHAIYRRAYRRRNFRSRKVSPQATRSHIAYLNSHGMGSQSIADCCGVGPATVRLIRQGKKARLYERTERRILSVTAEGLADGCLVDAEFTQTLLRELMDEGWTATQIAAAFQKKRSSLSEMYSRKVRAKTQMRVERLHKNLMKGGQAALKSAVV